MRSDHRPTSPISTPSYTAYSASCRYVVNIRILSFPSLDFAHLELLSRVFPPKRCRQFLRHAFCSFSTYQTPEPSPINQVFKIWDRATSTPPTALSPPLCFIHELNASEITSESKMLQYFWGIGLFPLSALSEPNYRFKPVENL